VGGFEKTATRLWKKLSRDERLASAQAFFAEPPQEMIGSALGAVVKARRVRPQVARSLSADEQARTLAAILDPGEGLASALLVALHLGSRREMLGQFLDAAGLAHENGILKDESASPPPLAPEAARAGIASLLAAYPRPQVETYLNTLWLQDPDRWNAVTEPSIWPTEEAVQRADD
jgi:hypothetical protein